MSLCCGALRLGSRRAGRELDDDGLFRALARSSGRCSATGRSTGLSALRTAATGPITAARFGRSRGRPRRRLSLLRRFYASFGQTCRHSAVKGTPLADRSSRATPRCFAAAAAAHLATTVSAARVYWAPTSAAPGSPKIVRTVVASHGSTGFGTWVSRSRHAGSGAASPARPRADSADPVVLPRPRWASEITSRAPTRPRAVKLRRNSAIQRPPSCGAEVRPRASR